MYAVITAGGCVDAAFAAAAGTPVKALAPVRGVRMLDRAIDAVRGAGAARIAIVGGPEVRRACADRVERVVEAHASGSENLLRALASWPSDAPLLYATSDLPYLDAVGVRDFIDRSPPGTLAISLTGAAAYAARFPGAPPFGLRLAGERVVNGGLFVLPPEAAPRVARVASAFFEARKRPWEMARLAGPVTLLRFAMGRLAIGDLEARATRVLGMPARAVRDCAPELAFDADTEADYRYACTHG